MKSISEILDRYDLTNILQKCNDEGNIGKYDIIRVIIETYPKISESDLDQRDDLFEYLVSKYSIYIDTVEYDGIFSYGTKIKRYDVMFLKIKNALDSLDLSLYAKNWFNTRNKNNLTPLYNEVYTIYNEIDEMDPMRFYNFVIDYIENNYEIRRKW